MGWIQLAHDRVQLRDAVSTVLNYRVPYGQRIFLTGGGSEHFVDDHAQWSFVECDCAMCENEP